jgi:hypothetical protein
VLWSFEVDKSWYEGDKERAAALCPTTFPLSLTDLIDKKREGPNKNGFIKVGADPGMGATVEHTVDVDVMLKVFCV